MLYGLTTEKECVIFTAVRSIKSELKTLAS